MFQTFSEGSMKPFLLGLFLWSAVSLQAQAGSAGPPQKSDEAHRASSASVDAGDYIYISAQGPRGVDGALPTTFAGQARQALDNLKAVVESAGITMDHVVYTTVYLTDIGQYGEMNRVYGEFFGKIPPARAVLGVAALPDPPIEINAVAVRDLSERRAVSPPGYKSDEPFSPGILTHDRLFVSAMPAIASEGDKVSDDPAAQVDFALDRMKAVVEAAGLDLGHMVFVNPYLTANFPARVMNQHYASRFEFGNTPARATIEVTSLPGGAPDRVHRRRGSRLEGAAGRAAQEHASEPYGEPVRFCRRYAVLLREEWFYPGSERRSLYLDCSRPAPADDAQSDGQS